MSTPSTQALKDTGINIYVNAGILECLESTL